MKIGQIEYLYCDDIAALPETNMVIPSYHPNDGQIPSFNIPRSTQEIIFLQYSPNNSFLPGSVHGRHVNIEVLKQMQARP